MARTHEYVVVALPWVQERTAKVEDWTHVMNQMAGDGWRLVHISDEILKGSTLSYATFERPFEDVRPATSL